MNKLAVELNNIIEQANPHIMEMFSELGEKLYFPKGILTQTAEAKQKAKKFNATIGIAEAGGQAMNLPSITANINGLTPNEYLSYAPSPGLPDLRHQWQKHIYKDNQTLQTESISTPIVTSGVTHGLSIAADMFVNPGDTVVIADKFWGNYNMVFDVRHGAKIVKYPLFSEDNSVDTAGFAEVLKENSSSGKIVVLINSPNNPTGYALTEQEAASVAEILVKTAESGCNIIAMFDDAYFGLFFEENICKESVFAKVAGRHERLLAIKLDGATKEDFVWGLRVGFITFAAKSSNNPGLYEALEKKAAGNLRGDISNCSKLSQSLTLKAMQSREYQNEKSANFEILKSRALKVKQVLSDNKYSKAWNPYPFNSGYFMCVMLKNIDAESFRLRLLEEYGIGVIATGEHDIRVAFSCIEETDIQELFDTMFKCATEMT